MSIRLEKSVGNTHAWDELELDEGGLTGVGFTGTIVGEDFLKLERRQTLT